MKKKLPRILACLMACAIAFNGIAIPKAKAAVVESALLSAALSTYLSATGFEFSGGGTSNFDVNKAITQGLVEQYDAFCDYLKGDPAETRAMLLSNTQILQSGLVKFNSAAVNLLNHFSDWLIDKLGLRESASLLVNGSVTVMDEPFLIGRGNLSYGGIGFTEPGTIFAVGETYQLSNGTTIWTNNPTGPYSNTMYFINDNLVQDHTNHNSSGEYYTYALFTDSQGVSSIAIYVGKSRENFNPYTRLDTTIDISSFGEGVYAPVSVSIPLDYESAPDLDEQYAMAVDTGMTFADEQSFIDSILNGTAAGTLNLTYTIEQATTGDVVVPDEDEEQVGILNWVKDISQSVKALPKAIAEAVANIFVPDSALTQEIADTYNEKFGFLTTVHNLGTDLLAIDAQTEPPVIYIHLEDAEGNIDYGGTVKALDMSWFARYKEDVDRITGGFLWVGFLWLLFKRASAIINGSEMVEAEVYELNRGFRRKKQ